MKKNPTFGAAKPLPGQPGYRVSESEVLEKEAKEMESRLRMLQERLKQDEESLPPSDKSGTKWKSARQDKGSIRSYAKDVHEKIKNKPTIQSSDPNAKATAKARRSARDNEQGVNFKNKNIDQWSINDVSDWLTSMMLGQYIPAFKQNEISGSLILDISLEDLDYMGITILGHRKVLLKSIEDLRKNKRITMEITAPAPSASSSNIVRTNSNPDMQKLRLESKSVNGPLSVPSQHQHQHQPSSHHMFRSTSADEDYNSTTNNSTTNNTTSGNSSVTGERKLSSAPHQKSVPIHWSNAQPLSSNKVINEDLPVNLADGVYDEDAERRAFQRAVMEWRTGKVTDNKNEIKSKSEPCKKKTDSQTSLSSKMNSNNDINDNDNGVVGDDSLWNNPFVDSINSKNDKVVDDVVEVEVMDEEAERRAFQRAVQEWRSGKADTTTSTTTTATPRTVTISDNNSNSSARSPRNQSAVLSSVDKKYRPQSRNDNDEKSVSSSGNSDNSNNRRKGSKGEGGGGVSSLAEGVLDEAKEHEEFRKAVDAWRTGSSTSTSDKPRLLADKLSLDMEQQYEVNAAKILEQKEFAKNKLLEANRILAEVRSKSSSANNEMKSNMTVEDIDADDEENDMDDDDDEDYSSGWRNNNPIVREAHSASPRYNNGCDNDDDDDGQLSEASSLEEQEERSRTNGTHIEVSLIESTMGLQDNLAEKYYEVEEASEED
eukprot:gene8068-16554_t